MTSSEYRALLKAKASPRGKVIVLMREAELMTYKAIAANFDISFRRAKQLYDNQKEREKA